MARFEADELIAIETDLAYHTVFPSPQSADAEAMPAIEAHASDEVAAKVETFHHFELVTAIDSGEIDTTLTESEIDASLDRMDEIRARVEAMHDDDQQGLTGTS